MSSTKNIKFNNNNITKDVKLLYLIAVTRTPESIELNTWLTWLMVINCESSSDLIKSIARRHMSRALLASPDIAATFLMWK